MLFPRKLQAEQLDTLLSDLHDFFVDVPAQVQAEEKKIISRIDAARSVHTQQADIAETIGGWLLEYFEYGVPCHTVAKLTCVPACLRRRFVTPEELPLWDIWYTGSTPFPSEVRSTDTYSS